MSSDSTEDDPHDKMADDSLSHPDDPRSMGYIPLQSDAASDDSVSGDDRDDLDCVEYAQSVQQRMRVGAEHDESLSADSSSSSSGSYCGQQSVFASMQDSCNAYHDEEHEAVTSTESSPRDDDSELISNRYSRHHKQTGRTAGTGRAFYGSTYSRNVDTGIEFNLSPSTYPYTGFNSSGGNTGSGSSSGSCLSSGDRVSLSAAADTSDVRIDMEGQDVDDESTPLHSVYKPGRALLNSGKGKTSRLTTVSPPPALREDMQSLEAQHPGRITMSSAQTSTTYTSRDGTQSSSYRVNSSTTDPKGDYQIRLMRKKKKEDEKKKGWTKTQGDEVPMEELLASLGETSESTDNKPKKKKDKKEKKSLNPADNSKDGAPSAKKEPDAKSALKLQDGGDKKTGSPKKRLKKTKSSSSTDLCARAEPGGDGKMSRSASATCSASTGRAWTGDKIIINGSLDPEIGEALGMTGYSERNIDEAVARHERLQSLKQDDCARGARKADSAAAKPSPPEAKATGRPADSATPEATKAGVATKSYDVTLGTMAISDVTTTVNHTAADDVACQAKSGDTVVPESDSKADNKEGNKPGSDSGALVTSGGWTLSPEDYVYEDFDTLEVPEPEFQVVEPRRKKGHKEKPPPPGRAAYPPQQPALVPNKPKLRPADSIRLPRYGEERVAPPVKSSEPSQPPPLARPPAADPKAPDARPPVPGSKSATVQYDLSESSFPSLSDPKSMSRSAVAATAAPSFSYAAKAASKVQPIQTHSMPISNHSERPASQGPVPGGSSEGPVSAASSLVSEEKTSDAGPLPADGDIADPAALDQPEDATGVVPSPPDPAAENTITESPPPGGAAPKNPVARDDIPAAVEDEQPDSPVTTETGQATSEAPPTARAEAEGVGGPSVVGSAVEFLDGFSSAAPSANIQFGFSLEDGPAERLTPNSGHPPSAGVKVNSFTPPISFCDNRLDGEKSAKRDILSAILAAPTTRPAVSGFDAEAIKTPNYRKIVGMLRREWSYTMSCGRKPGESRAVVYQEGSSP